MPRKDGGQKSTRGKESKSKQTGTRTTRRKLLIGLFAAVAAALIVVFAVIPGLSHPRTYSAPPPMTIDTGKQYTATIETEKGDLVLELFASDVPATVNNFVFLARDGFYNRTTFHRVVREPPFVVQGGCPADDVNCNPGYFINHEITEHTHVTGALSMARTSQPNTNGCQFFICLTPQPHLDGRYSVFGQLTEGWDVLDRIEQGDVITRITIEEK
jgi:peptidyl-prolyl cis-trans isomerase B (cyclophilin B)